MGKKEQKYNREQIEEGNLTQEQVDLFLEKGVRVFQEKQNLTVDGMAGPNTQKALALVNASDAGGFGTYPAGKGVYIRSLKDTGSPSAAVKKAKETGLDFVVIGSVWISRRAWLGGLLKTTRMNSIEDIREYSKAFRDAGIDVWVWGYPYPGKEQTFSGIILEYAVVAKAKGILLDPEKPYRGKSDYAHGLMNVMVKACKEMGFGLGVTSYAATWFFPDFPYEVFASYSGVYGSPQVYDNKNNMPDHYAEKAYKRYLEFGFNPILISAPGYNKTRRQWRKLVRRYPKEAKGIIVWDWKNLNNNSHLWGELTHLSKFD